MVNWAQNEIAVAASKDPLSPLTLPRSFLKVRGSRSIPTAKRPAPDGWDFRGGALKLKSGGIERPSFFSLPSTLYFLSRTLPILALFWGNWPAASPLLRCFTSLGYGVSGAALSYRRLGNSELQEKSRKRSIQASEFATILATENFPIKEQANAQNVPPPPT